MAFYEDMQPNPIATPGACAVSSRRCETALLCGTIPPPRIVSIAGDRVTVTDGPLIDAEWDLVRAFVRRVTRHDLRLRFGHPRAFDDEPTLRRGFDVEDGCGEMTWVSDGCAAIAGVLHRIMVSRAEAEIALLVRSDLKRLGIGEFLLRHALARSACQGLVAVSGYVLRENLPMLRLAAKLGFMPQSDLSIPVPMIFLRRRCHVETA